MTKKLLKQIIIWSSTSTLTIAGSTIVAIYAVRYGKKVNYEAIDNRTLNERTWDNTVNESNFVYNNLFFPLNGENLSTKYVFLQNNRFDSQLNKRYLTKATSTSSPLNDEKTFEISFANIDKKNILNSLEDQIEVLNLKLVAFKKANPNKNLAIDLGKDLRNRKIFARVWELKPNQEDQVLINNFMDELAKATSDFRQITKAHFFSFFNSSTFFASQISQLFKAENLDINNRKDVRNVERDFAKTSFSNQLSPLFLEKVTNDGKPLDNSFFKESSGFFNEKGSLIKEWKFKYYFKNLIKRNIVVTSNSFIDLENNKVKRLLYFNKLSKFDSDQLIGSQVIQTSTPWESYVKNPKWIVTKEFDITPFVEEAVGKNNVNVDLDIENFLLPDGSKGIWQQIIANPVVPMGLAWSGNYTPTIDSYIRKFVKLLFKLKFMNPTQIEELLDKKVKKDATSNVEINVQEKIKQDFEKNKLVNWEDFKYLISNKQLTKDIQNFWSSIGVLSNITSDIRLKSGTTNRDFSDVYRVYTMVMGMTIIANNLMPIIKTDFPTIYNRTNQPNSIFKELWNFFKINGLIDIKTTFNDFIGKITDEKGRLTILKAILIKGDNLVIPKQISSEILNIISYFGFDLSLGGGNSRDKIKKIIEEYLVKKGSLKTILVNLIGEHNKQKKVTDLQNKLEKILVENAGIKELKLELLSDFSIDDIDEAKIKDEVPNFTDYDSKNKIEIKNLRKLNGDFNFDIEVDKKIVYYGTAFKRVVNAVFENKTIDSDLLKTISEIVYESKLLTPVFQAGIEAFLPSANFASAKDIEITFGKIFANDQVKKLIKNFIISSL